MKLNIFRIPKDKVDDLRDKFRQPSLGMKQLRSELLGPYRTEFYFSSDLTEKPIPWVESYADFFGDNRPGNRNYFACYLWESEDYCFALSYGKAHFYIRKFCDHDFGTQIAKRIANENDIRQKASKRFAGRRKKDIRSYVKNSQLDIESGESIDYLQSSIEEDFSLSFGESGKFGSSVLLNPDIERDFLPEFITELIELFDKPERFALPRTTVIDNTAQALDYESQLLDSILSASGSTDFTSSTHDLYGVDFIFSGHEQYYFKHRNHESERVNDLTINSLALFISKYGIARDEIFAIYVIVEKEGSAVYREQIKDALDFIIDEEHVVLSQGRWMQFNEDYLEQLDEYINAVDVITEETDLIEIDRIKEDDFNKSMTKRGYINADKNFSKLKIQSGIPIEAWDLQKESTVYAVKIGTPQKLGYVCDQATNTLNLIRSRSNVKKFDIKFDRYCLWLILDRHEKLRRLSDIKSIIFKQKIESWARKSWDLGITPKLKISYIKQ